MKKIFTFLCLCLMCIGSAWGETKTLTFDLKSNPGSWPTANSTTSTNYTYTLDGVDYTFGLKNVKCNSGYLMLTQPAALGLPAISGYKLTKVVAKNSSGCSTSVNVGISSSASSADYLTGGAAQKWATQGSTYTYNLSGTAENTIYYVYVTSKNAQITELSLTYEGGTTPTKTLTSIEISGEPTKTTYTEGDTFDPAGLTVTGTYNDESAETITDGITWNYNQEPLAVGTSSIEVTATVDDITSTAYSVAITVDEATEYKLVTDASSLKDGDVIILGATKDGTTYSSGDFESKYLTSVEATLSNGVLSTAEAGEITLEAVDGGWNLIQGDKYINTKAAKALTLDDEASTVWTISIDDGLATISAGETYGRFLYNVGTPRFMNYASASTTSMLLPSIYKKTNGTTPRTFNLTVNQTYGWASMYLGFAAEVPEDATAYYAPSVNGTTVQLAEIAAGNVIPAETGVIVMSENESVTFVASEKTPVEIESNLFAGVLEDTQVNESVYVLSPSTTTDMPIFLNYTGAYLGANKSYIPSSKIPSNVKELNFNFGEANGIRTIISNDNAKTNAIYNLNGQRLNGLQKGLNIVNGKKLFIK